MPGVTVGRLASGILVPEVRSYLVEGSQTIYAGDWVVLVDNTNAQRVKKLTSTEITADYTETNVKGILGIAAHDIKTDADGNVSQIVPSTVESGARATYALPSYASGIDTASNITGGSTPDKGNARLNVILANDTTEFLIRAAGAADANVTITQAYIGTTAGIQITDTIDFKADLGETSGNGSCLIITGVDETDPNFNVSSNDCRIFVKVKRALQQDYTGLLWTT